MPPPPRPTRVYIPSLHANLYRFNVNSAVLHELQAAFKPLQGFHTPKRIIYCLFQHTKHFAERHGAARFAFCTHILTQGRKLPLCIVKHHAVQTYGGNGGTASGARSFVPTPSGFLVSRSHNRRYRGRGGQLMSTTEGELDPVVLITTLAELPRLLTKKGSEQSDTEGTRCTCKKTRILKFPGLSHGSKVQCNVWDSGFLRKVRTPTRLTTSHPIIRQSSRAPQ
jgi:hypothetical protein